MDKQTPYEVLIAQKVAQCTLPDIADAIWSSVNSGLGQPASGTHSEHGSPATASSLGLKAFIYFLAAVTIITVAVLVWHHKTDKKPSVPVRPETPTVVPPVTNQNIIEKPAESLKIQQVKRPPNASSKNFQPTIVTPLQKADSVINRPAIIVPPLDSSGKGIMILPRISDSIGAFKKPHGVKGIGDGAYKIVPTKTDSGKTRHQ